MKLQHTIAFFLFTALQVAAQQSQTVAVQGVVTDSRTGDPLPSVQIRLTARATGDTRPATLTAFTGTDGRFHMPAPPAEYTSVVQRPGYFGPLQNGVPQSSVTKKLTVIAGQQLPEQKFTLTPGGVITGRIVDEAGRPAGGMTIAAMQMRYDEGKRSLVRVRTADTNELGEYRIYWVAPGDYLVVYEPALTSVATATQTSGPGSSNIQTRTYFPGTHQAEAARLVQVAPGAELKAVDFALRSIPSFRISGKVINPFVPAGGPPPELSALPGFTLINRDSPNAQELVMSTFANSATMADRQAGLFDLRGIPAGRYDIYASMRNPAYGVSFGGMTSVDLNSQDVKDVTITVKPPVDLSGRLVASGNIALPEKIPVRLRFEGPLRVFSIAEINADATGSFAFKSLVEGMYRISVTPPPDTFVSEIRHGDRSILADGLVRISGDKPPGLEVILAPNAGSVSGSVTHPPGKTGADTIVVAVPDVALRKNAALFRTARPEDSGAFSLTNLAPGRYKLFAWESALETVWTNAEFLARHEDEGVSVTVTAGKSGGLRVPVIWTR
jgi:hypothetical protein